MCVHHEGLVVAYTWNRQKQMFVALGKEFDMLSQRPFLAWDIFTGQRKSLEAYGIQSMTNLLCIKKIEGLSAIILKNFSFYT